MVKSQDFTRGGIISPLVRFALPVLLAMFLQTMYGAVDLLVVGQFARSADVSAVSTGSQIMMTVTLVINSLAMGLTVLVARCIGAGQPKRAGGGLSAPDCGFSAYCPWWSPGRWSSSPPPWLG